MFYQNFIYNNLRPYFLAGRLISYIHTFKNRAKICDKNQQSLTNYSNSNRFLVEEEDISKYFQFFMQFNKNC